MNNKIAIIDASSRGLPYDYYFIKELTKYYDVDFFYSNTQFNYEYIELLKNIKNVSLYEYKISGYKKTTSIKNYFKLLFNILKKQNQYQKIHFFWSILFFL